MWDHIKRFLSVSREFLRVLFLLANLLGLENLFELPFVDCLSCFLYLVYLIHHSLEELLLLLFSDFLVFVSCEFYLCWFWLLLIQSLWGKVHLGFCGLVGGSLFNWRKLAEQFLMLLKIMDINWGWSLSLWKFGSFFFMFNFLILRFFGLGRIEKFCFVAKVFQGLFPGLFSFLNECFLIRSLFSEYILPSFFPILLQQFMLF